MSPMINRVVLISKVLNIECGTLLFCYNVYKNDSVEISFQLKHI